MDDVQLITLDPAHFHAALVQKEMYAGVSPRVAVYAPLGLDLTEHLTRVARFNIRSAEPTAWELDIHTGGDSLGRMLAEQKPGSVVVLSGRNDAKIERIQRSVAGGFHVLADKPWILKSEVDCLYLTECFCLCVHTLKVHRAVSIPRLLNQFGQY